MKKFLLTILIFSVHHAFAQSNEEKAQAAYQVAEQAYENQKYKDCIDALQSAVNYLGQTNSKIQYLLIKAMSSGVSNEWFQLQKEINKYFQITTKNDNNSSKYEEILQINLITDNKVNKITQAWIDFLTSLQKLITYRLPKIPLEGFQNYYQNLSKKVYYQSVFTDKLNKAKYGFVDKNYDFKTDSSYRYMEIDSSGTGVWIYSKFNYYQSKQDFKSKTAIILKDSTYIPFNYVREMGAQDFFTYFGEHVIRIYFALPANSDLKVSENTGFYLVNTQELYGDDYHKLKWNIPCNLFGLLLTGLTDSEISEIMNDMNIVGAKFQVYLLSWNR